MFQIVTGDIMKQQPCPYKRMVLPGNGFQDSIMGPFPPNVPGNWNPTGHKKGPGHYMLKR